MTRRWWRVPQEKLDELERLLRETDLSASACCERVGLKLGRLGSTTHATVHAVRRYTGQGRWIDIATGKKRPIECGPVCAVKKTGLSMQTIRRRADAGIITLGRSEAVPNRPVFSDRDIARLQAIGRRSNNGCRKVDQEDVRHIREMKAAGMSGGEILRTGLYPVSERQINRIARGDRWGGTITELAASTPPSAETAT